jgi:hypothetical protein
VSSARTRLPGLAFSRQLGLVIGEPITTERGLCQDSLARSRANVIGKRSHGAIVRRIERPLCLYWTTQDLKPDLLSTRTPMPRVSVSQQNDSCRSVGGRSSAMSAGVSFARMLRASRARAIAARAALFGLRLGLRLKSPGSSGRDRNSIGRHLS